MEGKGTALVTHSWLPLYHTMWSYHASLLLSPANTHTHRGRHSLKSQVADTYILLVELDMQTMANVAVKASTTKQLDCTVLVACSQVDQGGLRGSSREGGRPGGDGGVVGAGNLVHFMHKWTLFHKQQGGSNRSSGVNHRLTHTTCSDGRHSDARLVFSTEHQMFSTNNSK